jgi:hypothetical protein
MVQADQVVLRVAQAVAARAAGILRAARMVGTLQAVPAATLRPPLREVIPPRTQSVFRSQRSVTTR